MRIFGIKLKIGILECCSQSVSKDKSRGIGA